MQKKIILLIALLIISSLISGNKSIFADELTDKAWQALQGDDYDRADSLSRSCINKYKTKALMKQDILKQKLQQKKLNWQKLKNMKEEEIQKITLDEEDLPKEMIDEQVTAIGYAELNDVGTACFIQAEVLKKKGNKAEARKKYQEIIDTYQDAYCYDPRGWYWKVSDVAQDRIELEGTKYDYEDYTSETLTTKSWKSLRDKDFRGMEIYANKCIYLYTKKAEKMQLNIKGFSKNKKQVSQSWALNDVATCYFLMGEKYLLEGKGDLAKQMYQRATELGFALCWDPQGWYWKVGEVAKDRIDFYGTKYSFGDYKSVTLTNNAWQALADKDYAGVDLYCKKCIYLYEDKAKEMQAQITEFPKGSFVPYYWALNDVGTCYFILAESYKLQNRIPESKESLSTITNQFPLAQCWDKRGWYWQVAKASQKSLEEMQKQNP